MYLKRSMLLGLLALTVACGGAGTDGAVDEPASEREPAAESSVAETPASTAHDDHAASGAAASASVEKNFPDLEYLSQIPAAYRVAGRHPELLSEIPCYCPCELYGHGGLIDCYRSQHAAACATCLEEAVIAGQLIAEAGHDPAMYEQVAAQVKNRYRAAIVRSYVQQGQMPGLQTDAGRAYLQACSDCHQPPHPGMYTADAWRQPLARMEAYARQRDMEPDPGIWAQAVDYVRSTSGQVPPEVGERLRQSLQEAVEHLKVAEGESVYYPNTQDEVLGAEWFDRMVRAYRLAMEIPADALAATAVDDPACSDLLSCLNSVAGLTSEATVEAVEKLAAERGVGAND